MHLVLHMQLIHLIEPLKLTFQVQKMVGPGASKSIDAITMMSSARPRG